MESERERERERDTVGETDPDKEKETETEGEADTGRERNRNRRIDRGRRRGTVCETIIIVRNEHDYLNLYSRHGSRVSFHANVLKKGMNPFYHIPPAMSKYQGRLDYLSNKT